MNTGSTLVQHEPSKGSIGHDRPVPTLGSGGWLTLPMGLWLLSWLSLNAGPWDFEGFGHGLNGTVNAMRGGFPLVVFLTGLLALPGSGRRRRSWAEKGFWVYGIVALLACTGAKGWFGQPYYQAYWGFAFLGVLGTVELLLRSQDRVVALERLNLLSWIVTTIALVTMLFLARDVLIAPDSEASAYGVLNRFQSAHGYIISRETGLSRMAVVPAIIALVHLLSGKPWQRMVAIPVFFAAAYIIWIMQSRGALVSFAFAFLFVIASSSGTRRINRLALAVLLLAGAYVLFTPDQDLGQVWMHASRDQGAEGFLTQSGRTDIWLLLLKGAVASPVFGVGPQGDYVLIDWNGQNAFLYALVSGGIVGLAFFVAAMLSAWRALIRLLPWLRRLPAREQRFLQIAGAIYVFCTLRSIPENNAAMFSVDLFLQYPAMIYIVELRKKYFRD